MASVCLGTYLHLCFNMTLVKIHAKVVSRTQRKSFGESAKKLFFNSLNANFTKGSNTLKQFVGGCWHFVGFAFKGLRHHKSSKGMFVNRSGGNCFIVFLVMLPKHVHIGWKSQKILKSMISFILKRIKYFRVLDKFHTSFIA